MKLRHAALEPAFDELTGLDFTKPSDIVLYFIERALISALQKVRHLAVDRQAVILNVVGQTLERVEREDLSISHFRYDTQFCR